MMGKLIRWSITNRFLVLLATLMLSAWGIWSLSRTPLDAMAAICNGQLPPQLMAGMSTTIGIVATDACLSKAQTNKLAAMAHAGLARSINPVHTASDGDALFALATGGAVVAGGAVPNLTVLGALAAEVTLRAVLNAVRAAQGLHAPDLPDLPSATDLGLA